MKMYDVHSHLGKTSSGDQNDVDGLVNDMMANGITKVGISCLSGSETRAQNDLVLEAMRKYPDVVKGYAFINPKAKDVHEEIDRCLGCHEMSGVKFHPWKHGYISENTPEIYEVLDHIFQYGVHVQIHVGTSPMTTPFPWIEYAKKFPKQRFLFTHMGSREFGATVVKAVRGIENIWLETSVQYNRAVLLSAARNIDYRRIVFGVDWPYKPIETEVAKIHLMGFNEEQLEYVFYKNTSELWKRI